MESFYAARGSSQYDQPWQINQQSPSKNSFGMVLTEMKNMGERWLAHSDFDGLIDFDHFVVTMPFWENINASPLLLTTAVVRGNWSSRCLAVNVSP